MCRLLFSLSELSVGKHILSKKSTVYPRKVNMTHAIFRKCPLHGPDLRASTRPLPLQKSSLGATAINNTWNYLTDISTNKIELHLFPTKQPNDFKHKQGCMPDTPTSRHKKNKSKTNKQQRPKHIGKTLNTDKQNPDLLNDGQKNGPFFKGPLFMTLQVLQNNLRPLLAAMRMRSALSLMKPAASAWL